MLYGDMLIHFSEMFLTVKYFTQIPQVGAGYTNKSEELTTEIILQAGTGSEIEGPSGRLSGRANWRVNDISDTEDIWTREDSPLKEGYYIIHPTNGKVYIVNKSLDWGLYGGFKAWEIVRVQGNNGTTASTIAVKAGSF